jgi:uncharacterized protein (DUF1015 family)
MLRIRPFRAWRPNPASASETACVPYDVIDTDEARALAHGKPRSFLHVIRPEIDLSPITDIHDDAVYAQGRAALDRFMADGTLIQDETESHYIYRIVMGTHSQTGLFSLVSTADYDEGRIVRHELTRPDKEDDRTRHILTQEAFAEPVLLIAPRIAGFAEALKTEEAQDPLYDIVTEDGIRHTVWRSKSVLPAKMLAQADRMYVADGHHRCKAASRVAAELGESDMSFPAVIFPQEQLRILPYNRVLKSVNDAQWTDFQRVCPVIEHGITTPGIRGRICMYRDGLWSTHELPAPASVQADDKLDASRLQNGVLAPIFGIENPRTDTRIGFIGGIRGTDELVRLVDSSKADAAISMHPTSIVELIAVSDAGLLMPPKSTWFEPKLRSGLLFHSWTPLSP